ncbi:MAG: hypothetical protein J6O41_03120, partial [Clostridia bacterium]|nr:hypothetical protein [Clostridia bacterium]
IRYRWKNVVVPVAIVWVYFACYETNNNEKNTEKENDNGYLIENVGLYSTFLYASLYLLGMRLKMVQRFSTFFSTMTICFFCNQVVKSKYKDLIILISVVILILFGYITKDDFPYYFVWSQSH